MPVSGGGDPLLSSALPVLPPFAFRAPFDLPAAGGLVTLVTPVTPRGSLIITSVSGAPVRRSSVTAVTGVTAP